MAQSPLGEAALVATEPVPAAVTPPATDNQTPLTDRERALLDRIRSLEARLSALESKVSKVSEAPALATRFGVSCAYAREDRFNEINNPSPDNVQIRLADSTLLFATGTLAPGVTVQKADYYLLAEDAGFKYHGFFLMGEGYSRLLDRFQADGPLPMATIRDHGFFVQASQMVWPKRVEVYGATSRVYGDTRFGFGQCHEFLGGTNYYPVDSRNLRFNLQVIRVQRSPVSSVFGHSTAGQRGTIVSLATSLLF